MTYRREQEEIGYMKAVASEEKLLALLRWHREHEHDGRKAIR